MTNEADIKLVIDGVRDDSQEWMDVPGRSCIRLARQIGGPAIRAVSRLLAETRDNHVRLNAVRLLAAVRSPQGDDALTTALELQLPDEVREQIFEDAIDSPSLRLHTQFRTRAKEIYSRWPNQALRDFLAAARLI